METIEITPDGTAPTGTVQAFNPFLTLTEPELAALVSSFPKAFRDAQALPIALAQTEYKCTENDAIFVAWLKDEATKIMDRDAVNGAVAYITNLLAGVAYPDSAEVTLELIATSYNGLKVNLRKGAGIRIRDKANDKWAMATSTTILSAVYKRLGVKEADWMRSK